MAVISIICGLEGILIRCEQGQYRYPNQKTLLSESLVIFPVFPGPQDPVLSQQSIPGKVTQPS